MLLMSLFSWWYSGGIKKEIAYLVEAMSRSLDYFSVGLLLKTLFAPFRQIDAGKASQAPIDVKMRMFFDRLLSRFVGAFMRFFVIIIGSAALIVQAVGSVLAVLFYLLLPLLPFVGVTMYIIGWIPKWPL